jgi:hypothetical protein
MLSLEAKNIIDSYLCLPIGVGCVTPYFNNRRTKVRAGLRPLIGKGSPREIADEAEIIALRSKVDIKSLDTSTLKKFLVDKGLGIDCSGFAYHVLDAESKARKAKPLKSYLTFRLSPLRRLFARLRTAEQVSVGVLASDANSSLIRLVDVQPGDIVTLLNPEYNHVLVIESVERKKSETILSYVHSYAWPDEGVYGHGVRRGTLRLTDENLLHGVWTENGHTVDFQKIRTIERAEIRRLKAFQKR